METQINETSSTIVNAKETRSAAKSEGEPKYTRLKKALLVIFAIMVAGPLELLIILYI